ncbi:MAG: hypothetical protein KKB50_01260 [Planctomycetes bacterium]|nr:hypothetical protein [Planctomycetota bacterium]
MMRALLTLSQQPLVLRQLADEPELLENPEKISPPVATDVLAAIRELRAMPGAIMVAASYPLELKALRQLYAEAPEGAEERLIQLLLAYERAELEGVIAWQAALQNAPAALDEYRELLSRFCRSQLEVYADFPCVRVKDAAYYRACVPNEAIMQYAAEFGSQPALWPLLERWWTDHAPESVDERALASDAPAAPLAVPGGVLALQPSETRANMWEPVGRPISDSVDLVPVIMQPPLDQPPAARQAHAVAEHARLWAPPETAQEIEYVEQPAPIVESGELVTEPVSDLIVSSTPAVDTTTRREYIVAPTPEPVVEYRYIEQPTYETYRVCDYYQEPYRYVEVPTSYSVYYGPLVSFYCGYPRSWPLFRAHPCDLVRPDVCYDYRRYRSGAGIHVSYRGGRTNVNLHCGSGTSYYDYAVRRHDSTHGYTRSDDRTVYRRSPSTVRHRGTYSRGPTTRRPAPSPTYTVPHRSIPETTSARHTAAHAISTQRIAPPRTVSRSTPAVSDRHRTGFGDRQPQSSGSRGVITSRQPQSGGQRPEGTIRRGGSRPGTEVRTITPNRRSVGSSPRRSATTGAPAVRPQSTSGRSTSPSFRRATSSTPRTSGSAIRPTRSTTSTRPNPGVSTRTNRSTPRATISRSSSPGRSSRPSVTRSSSPRVGPSRNATAGRRTAVSRGGVAFKRGQSGNPVQIRGRSASNSRNQRP